MVYVSPEEHGLCVPPQQSLRSTIVFHASQTSAHLMACSRQCNVCSQMQYTGPVSPTPVLIRHAEAPASVVSEQSGVDAPTPGAVLPVHSPNSSTCINRRYGYCNLKYIRTDIGRQHNSEIGLSELTPRLDTQHVMKHTF